MNNGMTYVTLILDETGSMQNRKSQTISGVNEYLGTLRAMKEPCKLTLTLFNSSKTEVRFTAAAPDNVPDLTPQTYMPNELTPLYDAIGRTIRATEAEIAAHQPAPAVLCVIMTDGFENASMEFNRAAIFSLIKEKQAAGWTFVYLGADQDAWEVSDSIGIPRGNTMSYVGDRVASAFAATGQMTAHYMRASGGQSMCATNLAGGAATVDTYGVKANASPKEKASASTSVTKARKRRSQTTRSTKKGR